MSFIGRIALSSIARTSRAAAISCNAVSMAPRVQTLPKFFATLKESTTANTAWVSSHIQAFLIVKTVFVYVMLISFFTLQQRSCYFEINFTIPEEATVYEAVQRFAAYDIGCLVTTNANGKSNEFIFL